MCDRSVNFDKSGERKVHVPSSKESIVDNRWNVLEDEKNALNESSATFTIDHNLNDSSKSKEKICQSAFHDILFGNDRDYLHREPWSSVLTGKSWENRGQRSIPQPIMSAHAARRSNRPSKSKKNRPKRRCRRQYRDTNLPRRSDGVECGRSIDDNNENFPNYLRNYDATRETSETKFSKLLSKDCPSCGLSPFCSLNVSNTDLEAYADRNAYSNDYDPLAYDSTLAASSCENCRSHGCSSFIRKYPGSCQDWSNNDDLRPSFDRTSDLTGCCCSLSTKKCGAYSKDCSPSKASLFVETGESIAEFSRSLSSSIYDLPTICTCSNESPSRIEESSMTRKDIERDRPYLRNIDRVMFADEREGRCKGRVRPEAACCSHFVPKERYSYENASWNQHEREQPKAARFDYDRRENVRRKVVEPSSPKRTIDERTRCCETKTRSPKTDQKKEKEEAEVPRSCQSSLFGNFEIGKVWSQIQGVCKNLVQSTITNLGQAIKEISRSRDRLDECRENESTDCGGKSVPLTGGTCQQSYGMARNK